MIKFRCQRCSQKIAVNDEGIGVAIACPTCAEALVVPPRTDHEFVPHKADTVPMDLVCLDAVVETPRQSLARQIASKLVLALLAQRNEMIQNQDAATEQVATLEQRVILLQMKYQRRLSYYQDRIAALEAENHRLAQARPSRINLPVAATAAPAHNTARLPHTVLAG